MPRPNVLLIMTDQHRPDHTGFGGNTVVQTPTLDALAARSLVFEQAFVSNPLCQPNRCSIMTGRYPSVHGTRHNGIALDWMANTFVKCLRRDGYRTGLVGKGHLQNFGLHPDLAKTMFDQRFEEQAVDRQLPHGWDHLEHTTRHLEHDVVYPEDYYGFDHVEIVIEHGDVCSGHYIGWLREQGVDWRTVRGLENASAVSKEWDQVRKPSMPEELYPTSYVTDRSVAWIDQRAADSDPWFLQCSYPDPHHPFTPPGKYWNMFDPADMVLPRTFDDPHTKSPAHFQRMVATRGQLDATPMLKAPNESQLRHAAAAEFGAISMIDDGIAKVLGALERSGQAEDTIVIFTSDHGDMFGDHGLILKMFTHYEGCIRVPLTVAGPGIDHGTTRSLVSSLDLGDTILDLTGVDGYYGSQGRSMRPIIDDNDAEIRTEILIEEDQIRDGLKAGVQPRMRTLLTKDARITRYQGLDHHELFDLANDPDELENRWSDDASKALKDHLAELLTETMIASANPSFRPTYIA